MAMHGLKLWATDGESLIGGILTVSMAGDEGGFPLVYDTAEEAESAAAVIKKGIEPYISPSDPVDVYITIEEIDW